MSLLLRFSRNRSRTPVSARSSRFSKTSPRTLPHSIRCCADSVQGHPASSYAVTRIAKQGSKSFAGTLKPQFEIAKTRFCVGLRIGPGGLSEARSKWQKCRFPPTSTTGRAALHDAAADGVKQAHSWCAAAGGRLRDVDDIFSVDAGAASWSWSTGEPRSPSAD